MIDINELRRLAQAATPGPWHFWRGWVAADIDNDGGVIIVERPTPSGGKYQARVDSNFKFIAATNPAAVIELLDRLEAAEKERDALNPDTAMDDAARYRWLRDHAEASDWEMFGYQDIDHTDAAIDAAMGRTPKTEGAME